MKGLLSWVWEGSSFPFIFFLTVFLFLHHGSRSFACDPDDAFRFPSL